MSFRHTYVTEFLYKHGRETELAAIRTELEKHGTVNWNGSSNNPQFGYFHGVIKDLDSHQTRIEEGRILDAVEKAGARMKIVFE